MTWQRSMGRRGRRPAPPLPVVPVDKEQEPAADVGRPDDVRPVEARLRLRLQHRSRLAARRVAPSVIKTKPKDRTFAAKLKNLGQAVGIVGG
jgi:hypothetical protein